MGVPLQGSIGVPLKGSIGVPLKGSIGVPLKGSRIPSQRVDPQRVWGFRRGFGFRVIRYGSSYLWLRPRKSDTTLHIGYGILTTAKELTI